MLLEIWENGLTYGDRKFYFINVTGVDADLIAWAFRLFRLVRNEAEILGRVNTITWTGPTMTLREILDEIDYAFVPKFHNEEAHPGTTTKFQWLLKELETHPGPLKGTT